jgi:hypothetical protein
MENKLKKLLDTAIIGVALSSTVGCSTLKEKVWDYEPYSSYSKMSNEERAKLPVYESKTLGSPIVSFLP